ncbi:hypothetical protein O181_103035 [Austropuccinia psidii MF-1]|uniref:Uncharacterized protein n=1 Tax=Austropuccinia psidii MF-1 TaxID=1389203 RepID=A0A9Q3JKR9_9BASI|nr:hypothetical protein [Austropuccinia psidii MF-1]
MDGIHLWKRRVEGKQPSTTQTGAKTSPNGHRQEIKHEQAATNLKQGKGKSTRHHTMQPTLQNPKDSTRFHVKCVSDGENHDGKAE